VKFYFTKRSLQFSKFTHKSLGNPFSPSPLFFLSLQFFFSPPTTAPSECFLPSSLPLLGFWSGGAQGPPPSRAGGASGRGGWRRWHAARRRCAGAARHRCWASAAQGGSARLQAARAALGRGRRELARALGGCDTQARARVERRSGRRREQAPSGRRERARWRHRSNEAMRGGPGGGRRGPRRRRHRCGWASPGRGSGSRRRTE
jgi:hypothetical protein